MVFFIIAIVMAAVFVLLPILVVKQKPDAEKLSAYECGFEAFTDMRKQFDVRFYLVAILFIIFDLEVAFLFPWAIALGGIGMFGFISMMIFLVFLPSALYMSGKKELLNGSRKRIRYVKSRDAV